MENKGLGIRGRLKAAAQGMETVTEMLPGTPRIELLSNKRLLVENHKGILEYGDTLMRINCGRLILKITGEQLELKALSINELAIKGTIFTLEYLT